MFEDFVEKFNINKHFEIASGEMKFMIDRASFKTAINYLKSVPEYSFDILGTIVCVDKLDKLELNYILYSTLLGNRVVVSTELIRDGASIETVSDIFASANWDEREIYDLFGVNFIGHPDLRRLFMPKDWQGHPLRKDYKMEDERLSWNK